MQPSWCYKQKRYLTRKYHISYIGQFYISWEISGHNSMVWCEMIFYKGVWICRAQYSRHQQIDETESDILISIAVNLLPICRTVSSWSNVLRLTPWRWFIYHRAFMWLCGVQIWFLNSSDRVQRIHYRFTILLFSCIRFIVTR